MFRLGVNLNLLPKDVNEIFDLNIGTYQKIYQILTLWRDQTGQQADLNQIIVILQDMNKNGIAEKIVSKLNLLS